MFVKGWSGDTFANSAHFGKSGSFRRKFQQLKNLKHVVSPINFSSIDQTFSFVILSVSKQMQMVWKNWMRSFLTKPFRFRVTFLASVSIIDNPPEAEFTSSCALINNRIGTNSYNGLNMISIIRFRTWQIFLNSVVEDVLKNYSFYICFVRKWLIWQL